MWLIETSLVHHFRPFLKITKYSSSPTPVIINDVVSTEVFTDYVKGNDILSLLLVLLLSLMALFMLLFFLCHPADCSESGCDMESHLLEVIQVLGFPWYHHALESFCKLLCKSYMSTIKLQKYFKKLVSCSLCGTEVFEKLCQYKW